MMYPPPIFRASSSGCTFHFIFILLLLSVILGIVFALGYIGGLPKWYKDIRMNRTDCEDVNKTKDSEFWKDGAPVNKLDKAIWDVTMELQGNDPAFQTNLDVNLAKCQDST